MDNLSTHVKPLARDKLAAIGVCDDLDRQGIGQYIETSLLAGQLATMTNLLTPRRLLVSAAAHNRRSRLTSGGLQNAPDGLALQHARSTRTARGIACRIAARVCRCNRCAAEGGALTWVRRRAEYFKLGDVD